MPYTAVDEQSMQNSSFSSLSDDDIPVPVTRTDAGEFLQARHASKVHKELFTPAPNSFLNLTRRLEDDLKIQKVQWRNSSAKENISYIVNTVNDSLNVSTIDTILVVNVTEGTLSWNDSSAISSNQTLTNRKSSKQPSDRTQRQQHVHLAHLSGRSKNRVPIYSDHSEDSSRAKELRRKNKTEFYAWIFGATMLVLAAVSTAVSCVVFCFCGGEKWRRKKRIRVDDQGEYHRVENVTSAMEQETESIQPASDHVTVI